MCWTTFCIVKKIEKPSVWSAHIIILNHKRMLSYSEIRLIKNDTQSTQRYQPSIYSFGHDGIVTTLCRNSYVKDYPDGRREINEFCRKICDVSSDVLINAMIFGGKLILLFNDGDGTVKVCNPETMAFERNLMNGAVQIRVDRIHNRLYCFPLSGYHVNGYIVTYDEQFETQGLKMSHYANPKYLVPLDFYRDFLIGTSNAIYTVDVTGKKIQEPITQLRYVDGSLSDKFNNITALFRLKNNYIVLVELYPRSKIFIADPCFKVIVFEYEYDAGYSILNVDDRGNNCFNVHYYMVAHHENEHMHESHFEVVGINNEISVGIT